MKAAHYSKISWAAFVGLSRAALDRFLEALAITRGPKPRATWARPPKPEATRHEVESKALGPEVWGGMQS